MNFKTLAGIASISMLVGTMAESVTAQQATPQATPVYAPVAQGLIASVSRFFSAAGDPSSGIFIVEARIGEFETADQAHAIVSDWFSQTETFIENNYDYALALSPIAIETIADTTRAAIGVAVDRQDEERQYDVTALAVTDETLLYTFVMWSSNEDGLRESLDIAKRTLGIEPLEFDPVPEIDYETGGLWDLLPRIEHMPQGITWNNDYPPCIGVFGINECAED